MVRSIPRASASSANRISAPQASGPISAEAARQKLKAISRNEKQLWVHLLAHNVIRLLMAQAAAKAGVEPRGLSFKHTLQLWIEWNARGMSASQDDDLLFRLIAQFQVGQRPGRIEPRLRKRRPKPYGLLRTSRAAARQHVRKHGHPAKAK